MKLAKVIIPVENAIESLQSIAWFSSIGSDSTLNISEAFEHIQSSEWENFQLDRSGDITTYLSTNFREEYREWNAITNLIKSSLEGKVYPLIKEALATKMAEFPQVVFDSIKWDVLAYLQELSYSEFNIPMFYSGLIKSYINGKLPYGWEGNYPDGQVLEY